jgi:hypothetical protein
LWGRKVVVDVARRPLKSKPIPAAGKLVETLFQGISSALSALTRMQPVWTMMPYSGAISPSKCDAPAYGGVSVMQEACAHFAAIVAARISGTAKWLAPSLFDTYRPELHYMRGPGPKWRERHSLPSRQADAVERGFSGFQKAEA